MWVIAGAAPAAGTAPTEKTPRDSGPRMAKDCAGDPTQGVCLPTCRAVPNASTAVDPHGCGPAPAGTVPGPASGKCPSTTADACRERPGHDGLRIPVGYRIQTNPEVRLTPPLSPLMAEPLRLCQPRDAGAHNPALKGAAGTPASLKLSGREPQAQRSPSDETAGGKSTHDLLSERNARKTREP